MLEPIAFGQRFQDGGGDGSVIGRAVEISAGGEERLDMFHNLKIPLKTFSTFPKTALFGKIGKHRWGYGTSLIKVVRGVLKVSQNRKGIMKKMANKSEK